MKRTVRFRAGVQQAIGRRDVLDPIVVLADILPYPRDARPLYASLLRQSRIIGLVDRFDRTGVAIFEDFSWWPNAAPVRVVPLRAL